MSDNVVSFPVHKILRVINENNEVKKDNRLYSEMLDEEKTELALNNAIASLLMSLEEDGVCSEHNLLMGRALIIKRILQDTLNEMNGGPRSSLITELLVKI